jgi:CRP/FNR family cyclic AMP-dependent transcriptional regulator
VLLVVERVAVLRHVGMFSHAPGRLLAGLAQVLEEVDFPAGAVLMEAGAIEDWLFVLVEGEVDVTRQDRWIQMGPGTTIGEMELLDPQGRSATITARTPVRALRLSKTAFDEALRLSPDIARGVIIDLIRRLRETHEPRPSS